MGEDHWHLAQDGSLAAHSSHGRHHGGGPRILTPWHVDSKQAAA